MLRADQGTLMFGEWLIVIIIDQGGILPDSSVFSSMTGNVKAIWKYLKWLQ